MQPKTELKLECIRLRIEKRLSLTEIQELTGASKGSLSVWLRSYPLSDDERHARRTAPRRHVIEASAAIKFHPNISTNHKGEIAVLAVEMRALEKGAITSRPTVTCRYDLVVDWEGKLYRAQVKYADSESHRSAGAITVSMTKWTRSGPRKGGYRADEIDVLIVFIPRIGKVLWFDINLLTDKDKIQIRLDPALNGQCMGCRIVADYIW